MGINLLPRDDKSGTGLNKYKPKVYFFSTITLVTYIVIGSAVSGWWFFLNNREAEGSQEVLSLSDQVKKSADVEVTMRQVADRVTQINAAVAARKLVAQEFNRAMGNSSVVSWKYSENGSQVITVQGPSVADIEAYATSMTEKFDRVVMSTAARKDDTIWEAVVTLEGGKDEK